MSLLFKVRTRMLDPAHKAAREVLEHEVMHCAHGRLPVLGFRRLGFVREGFATSSVWVLEEDPSVLLTVSPTFLELRTTLRDGRHVVTPCHGVSQISTRRLIAREGSGRGVEVDLQGHRARVAAEGGGVPLQTLAAARDALVRQHLAGNVGDRQPRAGVLAYLSAFAYLKLALIAWAKLSISLAPVSEMLELSIPLWIVIFLGLGAFFSFPFWQLRSFLTAESESPEGARRLAERVEHALTATPLDGLLKPKASAAHCPYCRAEVDSEADVLIACNDCEAKSHLECWEEHGGCATCATPPTRAPRKAA